MEVYVPDEEYPNNTPKGLLNRAKKYKKDNELTKNDQVWLLFDSDENEHEEVRKVRQSAESFRISIAQSNPCIEVWIWYHYKEAVPENAPITQVGWKSFVDKNVPGGVDYNNCPDRVNTAIRRAETNFRADKDDLPELFSTECYLLMREIIALQGGVDN